MLKGENVTTPSCLTLSTALNLVHRNSFPKLSNFPLYFSQLCHFPGGGSFEKHADPGKKNRNRQKSRANSRNLLELFLRSRKEQNLYGHCAMSNAQRILSKSSTLLRGCWFWSGKLRFRKNFDDNFNALERVSLREDRSSLGGTLAILVSPLVCSMKPEDCNNSPALVK